MVFRPAFAQGRGLGVPAMTGVIRAALSEAADPGYKAFQQKLLPGVENWQKGTGAPRLLLRMKPTRK